jgi:maleate isomerase
LLGWRAKLGVLVPTLNNTMEPEFYKMAPAGVSVHFSKIKEDEEDLGRMAEEIPRAASELADAEVDIIAFGCTVGSLIGGRGYDERLTRQIEETAHIPAITTSTAVISALGELRATSLCVATAYGEELNGKVREFLEAHELKVLDVKGLGCKGLEAAHVSAKRVCELAKEVTHPDADALFISCTDLGTLDVLEELEFDLNRPVISSNQATMWLMLRKVGIEEPISGYGTLLAKMSSGRMMVIRGTIS